MGAAVKSVVIFSLLSCRKQSPETAEEASTGRTALYKHRSVSACTLDTDRQKLEILHLIVGIKHSKGCRQKLENKMETIFVRAPGLILPTRRPHDHRELMWSLKPDRRTPLLPLLLRRQVRTRWGFWVFVFQFHLNYCGGVKLSAFVCRAEVSTSTSPLENQVGYI